MSEDANPLLSSSPQAWERLIEEVEPASLLLVIERRLGAALKGLLAPEDVLQEALLMAWRDRRSFEWRGLRSFRAWLLTIIDHRIARAAERQAAAKRAAPGRSLTSDGDTVLPESDYPAGSTTPSRVAMYREQAETLRQALDGLPEEHREIVRLRYFEQRTLEEIAATLGLGVSAVRHRFRKGSEAYVRRLRAALTSRPPAPPESATARSGKPSPLRGPPEAP